MAMTASKTKRERGEATRQHIVEIAFSRFAKAGYADTSVEAILSEAGISKGAFYHHFKSKEQLFEAVFLRIELEVTRSSIEQTQHIADPLERLHAGCRTFIETASRPDVRQVGLIDAPAVLGWQRWRELEEQFGLAVLRAGLKAAAAARGRQEELPPEAARLLLAALIEATMIVARADDPTQALAVCEKAIQQMLVALVDS